jgi:peptidoglycan hydrolase CwlO-like protein
MSQSTEHRCFKRVRSSSFESDFDIDLLNIQENLINLNIDANKKMYETILKKINNLENNTNKLYIKIEQTQQYIDKIFNEKDYVIENLREEINYLKSEIKETKYDISNKNDYFS